MFRFHCPLAANHGTQEYDQSSLGPFIGLAPNWRYSFRFPSKLWPLSLPWFRYLTKDVWSSLWETSLDSLLGLSALYVWASQMTGHVLPMHAEICSLAGQTPYAVCGGDNLFDLSASGLGTKWKMNIILTEHQKWCLRTKNNLFPFISAKDLHLLESLKQSFFFSFMFLLYKATFHWTSQWRRLQKQRIKGVNSGQDGSGNSWRTFQVCHVPLTLHYNCMLHWHTVADYV